eukprot:3996665-Prymnesium_polylepis.1
MKAEAEAAAKAAAEAAAAAKAEEAAAAKAAAIDGEVLESNADPSEIEVMPSDTAAAAASAMMDSAAEMSLLSPETLAIVYTVTVGLIAVVTAQAVRTVWGAVGKPLLALAAFGLVGTGYTTYQELNPVIQALLPPLIGVAGVVAAASYAYSQAMQAVDKTTSAVKAKVDDASSSASAKIEALPVVKGLTKFKGQVDEALEPAVSAWQSMRPGWRPPATMQHLRLHSRSSRRRWIR